MTSPTVPNCNDARHPETLPHDDAFASEIRTGLTKREYFSAMALQGLLTRGENSWPFAVAHAVKLSDELIAELNRTAKGVL